VTQGTRGGIHRSRPGGALEKVPPPPCAPNFIHGEALSPVRLRRRVSLHQSNFAGSRVEESAVTCEIIDTAVT
jgi:hypothetical protein